MNPFAPVLGTYGPFRTLYRNRDNGCRTRGPVRSADFLSIERGWHTANGSVGSGASARRRSAVQARQRDVQTMPATTAAAWHDGIFNFPVPANASRQNHRACRPPAMPDDPTPSRSSRIGAGQGVTCDSRRANRLLSIQPCGYAQATPDGNASPARRAALVGLPQVSGRPG